MSSGRLRRSSSRKLPAPAQPVAMVFSWPSARRARSASASSGTGAAEARTPATTSARIARRASSILPLGGGARQLLAAIVRQLAGQDQLDQVGLAHLAVADGGVGRGCELVGEDHRAARMRPQANEHRREVGVAGQDDELVEVGVVHQQVAHVHDHADVGGVLELGGERRAVDHLEPGAQEVVAHERERVHVGGVVVRVAPRHGVAVAAVHDDAARGRAERARWWA